MLYKSPETENLAIEPTSISHTPHGVVLVANWWGIGAEDPNKWQKIASDTILVKNESRESWKAVAIRDSGGFSWVKKP